MAQSIALKNYFNEDLAHHLSTLIVAHHPSFPANSFIRSVEKQVTPLELKGRVAVISQALREHLPHEYPVALSILLNILGPENETEEGMFTNGYFLMPVAHFVEVYGLNDQHQSLHALYEITKRHTSEYAIRPYITNSPDQTYIVLQRWLTDSNSHVRRLVSEGTRPRLPWAKKINVIKNDVTNHFHLLEPLLNDPSPYVRKSVANHINDLSKSHTEQTVNWLETIINGDKPYHHKIVQHGLRTLIKQKNDKALDFLNKLM
ncbi:DNA alkylation repair protein [Bacillus sp. JCM 19034]|uniref:DNA alkylation repair protein n=1 Tax=Bacillus sp. JCM 19034 TaxID=1481928 RepID=UPI00078675C5|nr:DNA alkylation repair protein [Bacillus sp. JCM 19034]